MINYLTITAETPFEQIPDEVKRATWDIVEGWYDTSRIDWEDVWDRLDGTELDDGRVLDIETLMGPAIEGLKTYVTRIRRQG